jgi:hypothetical protein
MGFYIRKSFKIGPLHLNPSKSGHGASVGTKGARLGLSAKGILYTHLGRLGLYHRQDLGSVKEQPGPASKGIGFWILIALGILLALVMGDVAAFVTLCWNRGPDRQGGRSTVMKVICG